MANNENYFKKKIQLIRSLHRKYMTYRQWISLNTCRATIDWFWKLNQREISVKMLMISSQGTKASNIWSKIIQAVRYTTVRAVSIRLEKLVIVIVYCLLASKNRGKETCGPAGWFRYVKNWIIFSIKQSTKTKSVVKKFEKRKSVWTFFWFDKSSFPYLLHNTALLWTHGQCAYDVIVFSLLSSNYNR